MISLTSKASEKIKEMMASEGIENAFLRIGVLPGGCSGFSYSMGFDDEKRSEDQEFEQYDVRILVDDKSLPYLKGVEIDYQESGLGGGFTIHNPNAFATCGCGSSFRTANDPGQPSEEC